MKSLSLPSCLAAVLLVAALAPSLMAWEIKSSQTTIQSVLDLVAADVRAWIDKNGNGEIGVGTISQPPGITTSLGISEILAQRLRLSNLIVKDLQPPHYVEGRVSKAAGGGELVFQFVICKEGGEEIHKVTPRRLSLVEPIAIQDREITSTNNSAIRFAGITAPGKANLPELAQPASLIGIEGTQVFAKGAEAYRIEVSRKEGSSYLPLQPVIEGGLPVVKMTSGTTFGVRLINQTDQDAAIILEIDGVNFFTLCAARKAVPLPEGMERDPDKPALQGPAYTHYCLNKRDSFLITGWYRDEATTYLFNATDDEKLKGIAPGALAANNEARLGTISAQFYRAWDAKGGKAPPDALLAANFRRGSKGTLFTVPGKVAEAPKSELRYVHWEELNQATVSLRYRKK